MNIRARFGIFARSESGNSVVEFGLTAPFLIIALIMMLDLGIAVETRMEMDRNVRAGVQAAMSQINDPNAIRDLVLAATNGLANVSVNVNKTCSCGSTATSCTSWCSVQEPPSVFVNISAIQPYSGLMLPTFQLESGTHVQLR
jgi:Flp pilus assembly protein TadG